MYIQGEPFLRLGKSGAESFAEAKLEGADLFFFM
jgi:hypothetical protein